MFNQKTIILIKPGNEAKTEDGVWNQLLQCAMIDAYTQATGELSRFITKLYREKDPNVSVVHTAFKPLIEQQDKCYYEMVERLNDAAFMDNKEDAIHTLNKVQEIRLKQAYKLRNNWKNYGYFGMLEEDKENNDDTRELIKYYAEAYGGKVLLIRTHAGMSAGKLLVDEYDPAKTYSNFSYNYITPDRNTAEILCRAHNVPHQQLHNSLMQLEAMGLEYVFLIWN